MTVAFYLDCVSPHQAPLARELVKRVGADNFRYVYRDAAQGDRVALGWHMTNDADWFVHIGTQEDVAQEWIENADVMVTGFRDFDLLERRAAKGKVTFYSSERWFKPIPFAGCLFPGWMRVLHPRYLKMVLRFQRLAREAAAFHVLAAGKYAFRDMRLIGVPECKMTTWGYFVAPSAASNEIGQNRVRMGLQVLWVGRMIDWKRVDTIVKAVRALSRKGMRNVAVTLVGNGFERRRLEKLARGLPVSFLDSVSISEVRVLMRRNDVYVLPSDGREGWGAVVNEALEEGMHVLGTYEAGSSATMLEEKDLFHAGDWRRLAELLERCAREKEAGALKGQGIGEWSVEKAAERLVRLMGKVSVEN